MSPEQIGLIGFISMFVFLFMGMPIGFCMAFVGFLGEIFIFGFHGAVVQLGMVPYSTIASFTLCVIPLFMLMGEMAWASGLTAGSYKFAYKVLGRLPGGLAMSTVGACGIFAACTGSSLAGAATMTKIALPEMQKYKYSPELATGSIASGGTLGVLIPPSNPMILYSVLTGASIGKLFIAGILPGILLIGLFFISIYVVVKIKPSWGPPGEKAGLGEIINEGKGLWPALVLIGVVFGGLWGGVFSASEAGAIGSSIATLILIVKKGFRIKEIVSAMTRTTLSTAMIFAIVIGALIFGDYMTASNLPALIVKLIDKYSLSPLMVIFILMVIYVILGALMDELAIMLITIPVIFPSLMALHIDPIWFGILFVINQQMGLILPPVGMIVFVLSGMLPDIPMYTIYKGILPFAVAMFVCILLVMFFPDIAMLLPNTMIR